MAVEKMDSSDIINSVQYVLIIHWLNKVEAFIECESPWVLDVLGSLHSFSVAKNVGFVMIFYEQPVARCGPYLNLTRAWRLKYPLGREIVKT